ncbi:SAM-dependent methyltransferase [Actinomadura sp. HBU206391]|uniref:SAM-dependent methyltransferase n=1 Tax=Actinomadura sp. HBU206391 TaxID=2731692 RepID=UPI001650167E|nr:SAM-dependent methyltransferase [Actinomadura sp. HBU206391]MBC6460923.1 SAM-dependent methyltransferase [Actinomadura sp. HBU206391]
MSPLGARFTRSSLRQLVLVSTAWREWPPTRESCDALARLAGTLLGPVEGGRGASWLAVTADGAVRQADWTGGADAHERLEGLAGRLSAVEEMVDRPSAQEETLVSRRLRVLCDPERTAEVFRDRSPDREPGNGGGVDRPPWTALDVRFLRYTGGFRVHLGFSFWLVRPPWHPPGAGGPTPTVGLHRISELRAALEDHAAAATRSLVEEHFGPTTTLVWGREYAPPVFWVATLARPQSDPPKHLDRPDVAEGLFRPLIDRGPGDSGVAMSVINGNVLVSRHLRRELADPSKDHVTMRPVYLVLPGSHAGNGSVPKDDAYRQVVTTLTEFEARAAAAALELHGVDDDLSVWRTHVRVYESVAREAATLWDALALHLPIRRRGELEKAHRAIALVHQTLLQGVADLADLVSHVEALRSEVDELEEGFADLVDERVAEQPLAAPTMGIGESLAQMARLSRLRRLSGAVAKDAQRVNEQYKDLLNSIAHAFDERRVRELDVLQRGSFSLSLAVASVTIVAVLDFILNIKSTEPMVGPWRWAAIVFAVTLAFGVVGTAGAAVWAVRRARDISSAQFRRRYEKVLSYLRDSSTMELDRFRSATGDIRGDGLPTWSQRDRELAGRLAALWDEATAGAPQPFRERSPGRDIGRIAGDIEQWMLRALLLTERPRMLWNYRLPTLTLLYRHFVSLERSERWGVTAAVVADADLERTLQESGYTRGEARGIDRYIAALTTPGETSGDAAASTPLPNATVLLATIKRVLETRTPARHLERHNRDFIRRTVRELSAGGMDQFIDVGTGMPGRDCVHDLAPAARVLYVDNAPDVVRRSQALLTQDGRTRVIRADMRRPAEILQEAGAGGLIDVGRPVAVLFTRVLGYVSDEDARRTVAGFGELLHPGSLIVISHAARGTLGSGGLNFAATTNDESGGERLRVPRRIEDLFTGLALDPPGLVDVADEGGRASADTRRIHLAGGIGRVT